MNDMHLKYRNATLVLVDRQNQLLGQLPPVKISEPWFQEVRDLVVTVRETFHIEVIILRIMTADITESKEIIVTYLAELVSNQKTPSQVKPWKGSLDDHPLRLPYAKSGGPEIELDWARKKLSKAGLGEITETRQHRTWNLSSIWEITTSQGQYWLKSVPPFFAHEGNIISLFSNESVSSEKVPRLIAQDATKVLLHQIEGEDTYNATSKQILQMIEVLVDLQWRWHRRIDELIHIGVPDLRPDKMIPPIIENIQRNLSKLSPLHQNILTSFAEQLAERFSIISEMGIPFTLVHGDYHPGNWRGVGTDLTILDWGDCYVGHPMLDIPALLDRVPEKDKEATLAHWLSCWSDKVPNADVEAAYTLSVPLASAKLATTYQMFLDNIEPSERLYHEADVPTWLAKTADALT